MFPTSSRIRRAMFCSAVLGLGLGCIVHAEEPKPGAHPELANDPYKVHDMTRPRPAVITPGTASTPEQAGKAPSDAIVLFDGKDLSQWVGADGKDAPWKVQDGYMEAAGKSIHTRDSFGDVQLHLEWSEPTPPKGNSQGRGNSGVLFMDGRYEVQVLDCYQNDTYPDGQTGSVYGQHPPAVNACRPPGEWQTYDIIFHAPKFGDDKKVTEPGTLTVIHNGVLVQDHWVIKGQTYHAKEPSYSAHPAKLPLQLQFHGNPVHFRNIWIRPLDQIAPPTPAPAGSEGKHE